ncbi:hypothetical protein C5167_008271 [Papaver somniferum]|uniref:F-box domain-containing protein n=1 Tax=Papaver somniferum TaxID=3469 RepID=A0A4Y7JU25_PAPSO|nr:F-box protein At1g22220-like [Papaver somniferum]RZC64583.1 hypothetical protein C5167_008271 [Papaver somniferum]
MNSFSEDEFDKIPDAILLLILNQISDIKTLTHCKTVSKRFNSLVPQVETLLVKVDCVISTTSSESGDWFSLFNIIKSIFQSFQDLLTSPRKLLSPNKFSNSPTDILRGFEKIKKLEIELPSGDLKLEKGITLRWKAEFGKSLKSCVILAVRSIEYGDQKGGGGDDHDDEIDFHGDGSGGLKLRVVWTISSLIAASTRHYLLREVIKEHKEIESLVLSDRENEGKVVMNQQGLKEFRVHEEENGGGGGGGGGGVDLSTSTVQGWKNNRTVVPAVRMRMRHESKLDLSCGVRMRGATLVVVRPAITDEFERRKNWKSEIEERQEDKELALGAFDGVFGEAVEALMKRRSYLLEMNSF